jgi:hypothetical protein
VSTLNFLAVAAGDRILGPCFVPPRPTEESLSKRSSRAIATYGSSFMVHACRCSTTFPFCSSGILEQAATRWTNSMATSLPWFHSLTFSSSETSDGYCLCYGSLWRQGLVTTDTEWMYCDTWNFTASQGIAVKTCISGCWSSRWTLWAFYSFVRPMFI